MFTVALTGGIGSGKSEATRAFIKLGVPIVDLDSISHQLTAAKQPLIDVISAKFGQAYVTEDGALNRNSMRQLVFNDPDARQALNAILHPAIYNEATKQLDVLAKTDAAYAVLAIPLLDSDSPYFSVINHTLVIDCDSNTQINQVKQRSQLSEADIKSIMQAQISRKARLAMADDCIKNDGNIAELRQKVSHFHQKYIKTCIVNKTTS